MLKKGCVIFFLEPVIQFTAFFDEYKMKENHLEIFCNNIHYTLCTMISIMQTV